MCSRWVKKTFGAWSSSIQNCVRTKKIYSIWVQRIQYKLAFSQQLLSCRCYTKISFCSSRRCLSRALNTGELAQRFFLLTWPRKKGEKGRRGHKSEKEEEIGGSQKNGKWTCTGGGLTIKQKQAFLQLLPPHTGKTAAVALMATKESPPPRPFSPLHKV